MKKWQIVAVIVGPSLLVWLIFGLIIASKKGIEYRDSKEREARLAAMSEQAAAFLEERYGEDFVCYSYDVYAPARDESIKFAVKWEMDEDRNYYVSAEHYAAQIANGELAREISEELADLWGNFRADCRIVENSSYGGKKLNSNDETTIQMVKNGELDWLTYMEHCAILYNDAPDGYYRIELHILVDESSVKCSAGEEYDAILKVVEKTRGIASPNNVKFLVYVYGAPAELYGKCDDIIESDSGTSPQLRYLEPYGIIKADGGGHFVQMDEMHASDGKAWTLDRQEYIENRTAEFVETEKADK